MEATYLGRRSDPTVNLSVSGPRATFVHTLPPTLPDKSGVYDYKSLEVETLKYRLKYFKLGHAAFFLRYTTQIFTHKQLCITLLHL